VTEQQIADKVAMNVMAGFSEELDAFLDFVEDLPSSVKRDAEKKYAQHINRHGPFEDEFDARELVNGWISTSRDMPEIPQNRREENVAYNALDEAAAILTRELFRKHGGIEGMDR